MKKYIVFIIIVIAVILASGWLYIKEADHGFVTQPSTSTVLPAGFGDNFQVLGLSITPVKVLQDSRCPTDVQCIQAGTVVLQAAVSTSTATSTATFTLNKPTIIGVYTVTLTSVTPDKKSKVTIAPADYGFTFSVSKQ